MAIAFDAASTGGTSTATSLSWSHTCTGANLRLFVAITGRTSLSSNDTLSVTYNSIPLNLVQTFAPVLGGFNWLELWMLDAPTTGAHTVAVQYNSSTSHSGAAVSYTGCAQSGIVDAEILASEDGFNSLDLPITTVVANCWLIAAVETPAAATLGYTGLTQRQRESKIAIADSATPVSVGAQTVTVTTDFVDLAAILTSFAPATADGDGGVSAHEEYDRTVLGAPTTLGSGTN